jgi:hypothetical protein
VFLTSLGQYEAGLKEFLESLRLAPYDSFYYREVVFTNLLLNRVDKAGAAASEAHEKGLDFSLAPVLYGIAFYQDGTAGMAQQVASAAGTTGDADLLFALEADTAAYFGSLGKAREFSRQAANSAERAGEKETATGYYAVAALREALFGEADKARQKVTLAKGRSTGRDIDYGVALALAYAGDDGRAQALADDLDRKFPEDTIVQLNYLPTLRARLALSRAHPQQALDSLAAAAPYELGLPSLSLYNWPNLYPVYVRGEAYLAVHQGRQAAAEFQKILDHRGIVLNEPIGALAHLQLERAYALQGDTAKARVAYQDFLTLWKDADPDIPILTHSHCCQVRIREAKVISVLKIVRPVLRKTCFPERLAGLGCLSFFLSLGQTSFAGPLPLAFNQIQGEEFHALRNNPRRVDLRGDCFVFIWQGWRSVRQ